MYYETGNYLNKLSLPGLQDGSCLVLIPVYIMDLVVIFEVLVKLFGTHEEEHALKSLRTVEERMQIPF